MHDGVQAVGRQRIVCKLRHAGDAQREKIRQPLTQNAERHPEYEAHDGYKGRDSKVFVREHLVYPDAAQHLLALLCLYDALGAHGLYKAVSHLGQSRVAVKPALGFHLEHGVAYKLKLIFAELERGDYLVILLNNASRGKARGYTDLIGMILNNVADGMYAAVHRASRAEVYPARLACVFGSLGNDAHKLVNAVVLRRRYRHNGYAKSVGQLLYINASMIA